MVQQADKKLNSFPKRAQILRIPSNLWKIDVTVTHFLLCLKPHFAKKYYYYLSTDFILADYMKALVIV